MSRKTAQVKKTVLILLGKIRINNTRKSMIVVVQKKRKRKMDLTIKFKLMQDLIKMTIKMMRARESEEIATGKILKAILNVGKEFRYNIEKIVPLRFSY